MTFFCYFYSFSEFCLEMMMSSQCLWPQILIFSFIVFLDPKLSVCVCVGWGVGGILPYLPPNSTQSLDVETKQSQKIWRWRHVRKLWRHCHFPDFFQFGAIRKPDSGYIVCRIYIFINSNLLSYKNWKQK